MRKAYKQLKDADTELAELRDIMHRIVDLINDPKILHKIWLTLEKEEAKKEK